MTTTTIQPCQIDSRIPDTAPTTNYGKATALVLGKYSTTSISRSLIKFDLSGVPAAEICDSAVLSLWLLTDYATTNVTWSVYRLLRNWGETTVTWDKYDGTNNWGTAGASNATDINATPLGTSATIDNGTATGTEIQISLNAAEIQKLYDGTYSNYGFLIKSTGEESNGQWEVYSREHATTANRPKLVIVSHSGTSVPAQIAMLSDYGIL